jgi:hypothetical protein
VRLLPFAAGIHPASNGAFTLFEFADDEDPRIVCIDTLITTLYREGQREVGPTSSPSSACAGSR